MANHDITDQLNPVALASASAFNHHPGKFAIGKFLIANNFLSRRRHADDVQSLLMGMGQTNRGAERLESQTNPIADVSHRFSITAPFLAKHGHTSSGTTAKGIAATGKRVGKNRPAERRV